MNTTWSKACVENMIEKSSRGKFASQKKAGGEATEADANVNGAIAAHLVHAIEQFAYQHNKPHTGWWEAVTGEVCW